MSKLIDFEDTQAAIFLLRLSFGIVRATHFMRTTPLSLWSKQAEEFDEKVSQTVFQCLGLKPTDEAYAQASVSTTIGGLGVRRILDHANGAFTASWYEAQVITGEKWTKLPDKDCSGVYNSQRTASKATDVAIMAKLKAVASLRDAQRLNRLDSPHANAWLSARPSCMDRHRPSPQNLPHSRCPSPRPTRVLFLANYGPHGDAARSPATELRGTTA